MWRLWDTDSQEVQEHWQIDNESTDGIPLQMTVRRVSSLLLKSHHHWYRDDASSQGLPKPYLHLQVPAVKCLHHWVGILQVFCNL